MSFERLMPADPPPENPSQLAFECMGKACKAARYREDLEFINPSRVYDHLQTHTAVNGLIFEIELCNPVYALGVRR